ncbi:hypothetical protein HDU76_000283 [Blyttiomyces sp. JEL0837]|nr:hypothetical protein HDU76_000283 [Blyttiomyces sp. JEL0837]
MFIFIFLSLGGVQAALSIPHDVPASTFLYIALIFGFGLTTAVWITYRISGGALNPAVNMGLLLAGIMPPIKALAYTIAQMLGATLACLAVSGIFPNSSGSQFKGINDVNTASGITVVQAFFLEALLTMGLVLVVLFIAVEKSKATFMAPLLIGIYGT